MKRAAALALAMGMSFSVSSLAQVSDDAVRIAIVEDMSGIFADLSGRGSVLAARMAAADFGGSVLGKPIDIVSADHQNKPDIAATLARSYYDVGKVDVVAGLGNGGVALTVHNIAKERGKISIVVTAANDMVIEKDCSPTGILWMFNGQAIQRSLVQEVVRSGGDSWFFVTSDYAGGHNIERMAAAHLAAAGAKVIGAVRAPLGSADFASFLLQAQASGAKVVSFVAFGNDLINMVKQAQEFGLANNHQRIVPAWLYHSDLRGIGLRGAQGLVTAAPFYWNMNDETRIWSARFEKETGRKPDMPHAGTYTAVLHYLKAIQAAGTDEPKAVIAKMREIRINDMHTKDGYLRRDGMAVRDIYLFRTKSSAEARDDWDMLQQTGIVDKDVAFRPADPTACPLLTR